MTLTDRYVVLNDGETFTDLKGATVVEYSARDRGPFEWFYQRALAEGDGQTIARNADRVLSLDPLFAGLTFQEIGAALDAAREAKGLGAA
jgi:hypothetical protein